MAEVTLRRCDVFETLTKEVRPITVTMADDNGKVVFEKALDLSPRAIERAKKFLDRATTPPKPVPDAS